MKKQLIIFTFLFISFSIFSQVEKTSELYKTLKVNDSIIFDASFNTCNLEQLAQFINDDLEFYHDKAGLMVGKDKFIENTKNGLCKSASILRRELNESSLEVFALNDSQGNLYAAIQKGIHSFYENDKKGSVAKFTHLWVLKGEEWKLKRVLSYDHKKPENKILKKEVTISASILMKYTGEYEAPKTGRVVIAIKNNSLFMQAGKMQMAIFPESETMFFNKKQPLSFEFIKGPEGIITKMIVRENGRVVEQAKRVN